MTPSDPDPLAARRADSARLLETILIAIGTAEDFSAAIGATLAVICDATGWCAGQAWVTHESGTFLVAVPVFHCTDDRFHAFRTSTDLVTYALDAGLPGRACTSGEPQWSGDLADFDPPRRDVARAHGLTWVFAFPISGNPAGAPPSLVLECFGDSRCQRAEYWVAVVHEATARLGPLFQRKREEQTLRESAGRYRSVIEGAPFGFMRTTVAGRIVDANASLATMLGYESVEEVRRLDLGTDVYVDAQDRTRDLEVSAASPLATGIERRWKKKDGAAITVRLKGRAVLDARSGSVEFETIVEDVTEVVELESQLRLAQKMEAVGRLAGGIAHDFNNMLMAISGYAEMLLGDLPVEDSRREDVNEIYKAAERAAVLTRQLLAFSRRQPIAARQLDLCALVGDMDKMLRRLIREDVELVTKVPDAAMWILADSGQMEQVLMNLVVNARDAIPANGRVTIEVSASTISEAAARRLPDVAPGHYVTLTVADTGSGIPPEVKTRIFEPFFTTKEPAKGTGLGLSTVYGIVRQAKGHIGVESQVGSGSTFTIYLPDGSGAAAPRERVRADRRRHSGRETILLVEDEPSVRVLVNAVLARAGYRVLDAGDADAAMAIVQHHRGPIDLLLTDVVMPKMNGRDLARAIAARRPRIPVLFMSGYTDSTAIEAPEGAGAYAFLQKPFAAEALMAQIRELLDASFPETSHAMRASSATGNAASASDIDSEPSRTSTT
jgi:PAS domain S-box-containing protein